jgi:DNA-binding GntR family transcriptional regulator
MEKKLSAEQFVYNTLSSAILSRRLAPGSQLVEIPISEKLKISRTPIRNAIRKLASERLVNIIPNKGAFVVNPSIDEIKQAYRLRQELEIIAAKQSIHHLDTDDYNRMKNYLNEEDRALEDRDLKRYLQANKNFHMVISEKSGNKFLNEFIERLIDETMIYLILFDSFFEGTSAIPNGPTEHKQIVSALKQKDLKKVENILKLHYENSIKSLSLQDKSYQSLEELF